MLNDRIFMVWNVFLGLVELSHWDNFSARKLGAEKWYVHWLMYEPTRYCFNWMGCLWENQTYAQEHLVGQVGVWITGILWGLPKISVFGDRLRFLCKYGLYGYDSCEFFFFLDDHHDGNFPCQFLKSCDKSIHFSCTWSRFWDDRERIVFVIVTLDMSLLVSQNTVSFWWL